MLQARALSVEIGGRLTLADATFSMRAGDKVGLVGRNGVGKTSLLGVLAGYQPPAGGVVLRSDALGYLSQDPPAATARTGGADAEATGLSHVLSGRDLDAATKQLEAHRERMDADPSERNVARFARAEDTFRLAGGYAAESEARRLAHGLGLPDDRLDLPITALSGGERRRVDLARILFAGSELLLLDEPTNHLDTDAKQWLTAFLRSYRGALLVVSHDLDLLDESITRVLHLDDGQLTEYRGTYSQYLVSRAADEERLRRVVSQEQSEIKRLTKLADTMRGQTVKRAKTAKAIDTRVARLERDAATGPRRQSRVVVRFPEPPRPGAVVLRVEGLKKGYGGPPVFSDVTFEVGRGERLLVMGLNGAGKTSLMRILAEQTEADSGSVQLGHGASVGYYAQEHEGITPGRDVLAHLSAQAGQPSQQLRSLLGTFGLRGEIAFQDAGTLSGGEKTKLALAQLVVGRHNTLLLDEPTNNLDPPSRDAIGDALSHWPGAIVLVSHDAEFVARLQPDRVLLMPEGDLDYWSDDLLDLVALA
jgi:ATPase subunit of ABC transporter with duplicated ATPase domains